MRGFSAIVLSLGLLGGLGAGARAAECPGNPNALGTSRVMTIDPRQHPRLGTIQYPETLPLADKEVVLTFDDGPMPPYTNRILETLAHECVKANYFIIGRMARGYPELLRRIHAEGHVVGTHSENHPLAFERMPPLSVRNEIDQGIASTTSALGSHGTVAPFFRIPGLLRAESVEAYLRSRGLVTWSADIAGDDWKHISANEVVNRTMSRLDARGKGIILLHDIQPATALALPNLLRELKRRGYRVVQVAPADGAPLVASAPQRSQPAPAKPQREVFIAPRSQDDPPPIPATPLASIAARAEQPIPARPQNGPAPVIERPRLAEPPFSARVAATAAPPQAQARTQPATQPAQVPVAAAPPVVRAPAASAVAADPKPAVAAVAPGELARPLTPGFKPSHSISVPTKLTELPVLPAPPAPRSEPAKVDGPARSAVEAPTPEAPASVAPKTDEPGTDAPKSEIPKSEIPKSEIPKTDPWAWRAQITPEKRPPGLWPVTASALTQAPSR